jgi:carboxymethylenebutenolidase
MGSKYISVTASDGGVFQAYLSTPQSGSGPGLVVLQEIFGVNDHIRSVCDLYAQEGYVVIAPDIFWRAQPGTELGYDERGIAEGLKLAASVKPDVAVNDIASTIKVVRSVEGVTGKVGVLGFCFGGKLSYLTAARTDVDVAVCYYGGGIEQYAAEAKSVRAPIMFHWGAEDATIGAAAREAVRAAIAGNDRAESYVYADAGHGFNCDQRASYHRFSARLAHSRTLGLLRWSIGPRHDLSELWERHLACEFMAHDADRTMRTMVPQPYVNHVPTQTGGVGYTDLRRFYADYFVQRIPADTKIIPVTRTIGPDRIVDEFVVCFTHDREVDFMAPGIPATGKYVEVPHVAVVEFRGDKVAHEHIHWDHASFLKQLGVLDANGLPISGVDGAKKLVDETLPSNRLMPKWQLDRGR